MFAKLIASSIDNRHNKNQSPRFSSILRQLSPSDAILLKKLSFNTELPIPTFIYTINTGAKNEYPIFDHYIGINYSKKDVIINEAGLDTLKALGIIELKDNFEIPEEHLQKFYKEIKCSDYPLKSENRNIEKDISIVNGIIKLTNFGRNFIKAII